MTSRLLKIGEVSARTSLSRATLYRLINAGSFPRPVPLGGGLRVAFLESEIDAWIENRIIARDVGVAA